jgi:hypothetical protein
MKFVHSYSKKQSKTSKTSSILECLLRTREALDQKSFVVTNKIGAIQKQSYWWEETL